MTITAAQAAQLAAYWHRYLSNRQRSNKSTFTFFWGSETNIQHLCSLEGATEESTEFAQDLIGTLKLHHSSGSNITCRTFTEIFGAKLEYELNKDELVDTNNPKWADVILHTATHLLKNHPNSRIMFDIYFKFPPMIKDRLKSLLLPEQWKYWETRFKNKNAIPLSIKEIDQVIFYFTNKLPANGGGNSVHASLSSGHYWTFRERCPAVMLFLQNLVLTLDDIASKDHETMREFSYGADKQVIQYYAQRYKFRNLNNTDDLSWLIAEVAAKTANSMQSDGIFTEIYQHLPEDVANLIRAKVDCHKHLEIPGAASSHDEMEMSLPYQGSVLLEAAPVLPARMQIDQGHASERSLVTPPNALFACAGVALALVGLWKARRQEKHKEKRLPTHVSELNSNSAWGNSTRRRK